VTAPFATPPDGPLPEGVPPEEALAVVPAQPPVSRALRAISALRQRNFRLFWSGQLVSVMGSWMQTIGQAWLVLELTHNAFQLGVVGALQWLPVLLFSVVAGVFADHWPKRRVLLITQSAAMIQALVLWALVVTGTVQLWHVYVLALLLGFNNCLDQPARLGFVVEMAGRDDLPNAIALNSSLTNLARIVGPAIGGVLIAASGVALLFLLNAVSFLAVIVALLLIDVRLLHGREDQRTVDEARQNTWQRLREGLSYVQRTTSVALVIVVVGIVLLFGSNFNVVLPLFATVVLHAGAPGFGFLSAAFGLGSLLASLWLAWNSGRPASRGVLIGATLFCLVEATFALSRWFPLSLALLACVGFAENAFVTLGVTAVQLETPDRLQGRVMGVTVLFLDGSVPPGYLLMGWLSSQFGAPDAVLMGAGLGLLVVGGGWMWRWSAKTRGP
jgi:MFS family permease